jgi:ribonuclease PH
MLALLTTPSIPLRTNVSAVEVVIAQNVPIPHPTETQRRLAQSRHVLAFDNNSGQVVFCESWGEFGVEEWLEVVKVAGRDTAVKNMMREEVKRLVRKELD